MARQVLIAPRRNLVATEAGDLRREFDAMVGPGAGKVVIDLSGVTVVDPAGVNTLVATHRMVREAGGELVVINARSDIYRLLLRLRVDRLFVVKPAV